ncbi:hypothetical protein N665_0976s0024 [Sinapis alba]|nr:hypothetical protein N665_0976s0024 [Sinapis alba]
MAIAVKNLIPFVLTIFLLMSFIDCRTLTAETPSTTLNSPGYGIGHETCSGGFWPCKEDILFGCTRYCNKHKYDFGRCTDIEGCCCY